MEGVAIVALFFLAVTGAAGSLPHTYIVSFKSYRSHASHEATLRSLLSLTPRAVWHLLPRPNAFAYTYPTDFVLLEAASPSVVSAIVGSPNVARVTPQMAHTRAAKTLNRMQKSDFDGEDLPPALHAFSAGTLWREGHLGQGVKVAVFDTGLLPDHTYFRVIEATDWTGENVTVDTVGHGTFVAGLIAGSHPACPGLAPRAELYTFRVFTGTQVSYTSWFLDAFNYALHLGIDVLNLSIGGPDFADLPFTEKVDELAANGIIVVSAIGNDGPLWGSLNNPGDMMPVVGVGGAEPHGTIAKFSSRGMTTHEMDAAHASYGRVKPDLVTYGRSLIAPDHKNAHRCRKLSGTSVASPVVAGAIVLLASTVPKERRRRVVNPASVKKALMESARRLRLASLYEQGAGLLSIEDAFKEMKRIDEEFVIADARRRKMLSLMKIRMQRNISVWPSNGEESAIGGNMSSLRDPAVVPTVPGPSAAFFPAFYDLTSAGCPHMWPHCAQPLFRGGLPVTLNVTVLNPGGVQGRVENVTWSSTTHTDLLDVKVTPPQRFWPWAAGMGIHISVQQNPKRDVQVEGVLKVRVVSVNELTHSDIALPIKVDVIPTPARENRLLWDAFHSIRYPPGYVPRDSLAETKDMLDWLGDHPHTNFHSLLRALFQAGFFVDILDTPITCLSEEQLLQYGGLLILDSEDYFSTGEMQMVERLVKQEGLALIVAAEWYNPDIMRDIRFEDDNTRSWWTPIVAGGNVPALNDLLAPFDIALGEAVVSGDVKVAAESFRFESGVPIVAFPPNGELLFVSGMRLSGSKKRRQNGLFPDQKVPELPVLGVTKSDKGAVLVFGDTNCIDTAYRGERCYGLFVKWIRHTVVKCAMVDACEKMIPESRIVREGLLPVPSSLQMVARLPSGRALELFKPHSRVLGVSGGLDRIVSGRSEGQLCALRASLQRAVRVVVARRDRNVFSMPTQRRAEPLGSESKYFQAFEDRWLAWMHVNRGNSASSMSSLGDMRVTITPFRLRLRSALAIVVGMALILISVSLRKKRSLVFHLRRLYRHRVSRSNQSFASTASNLSDCMGRLSDACWDTVGLGSAATKR